MFRTQQNSGECQITHKRTFHFFSDTKRVNDAQPHKTYGKLKDYQTKRVVPKFFKL